MTALQKILIVENDEMTAEVLDIILEENGYAAVRSVPPRLFADLAAHSPALVLMDVWLDGVSGDDLCRSIKQHADYGRIPVILMSAANGLEVTAGLCSADGYVEKPFDLDHLVGTVRAAIADAQQKA